MYGVQRKSGILGNRTIKTIMKRIFGVTAKYFYKNGEQNILFVLYM